MNENVRMKKVIVLCTYICLKRLEKGVDIEPIFLSRNFYVFIEFSYISARLPVPAMRLKEKLFIGVSNFFLHFTFMHSCTG